VSRALAAVHTTRATNVIDEKLTQKQEICDDKFLERSIEQITGRTNFDQEVDECFHNATILSELMDKTEQGTVGFINCSTLAYKWMGNFTQFAKAARDTGDQTSYRFTSYDFVRWPKHRGIDQLINNLAVEVWSTVPGFHIPQKAVLSGMKAYWIQTLTGSSIGEASFAEWLRDSKVLCAFFNAVSDGHRHVTVFCVQGARPVQGEGHRSSP